MGGSASRSQAVDDVGRDLGEGTVGEDLKVVLPFAREAGRPCPVSVMCTARARSMFGRCEFRAFVRFFLKVSMCSGLASVGLLETGGWVVEGAGKEVRFGCLRRWLVQWGNG